MKKMYAAILAAVLMMSGCGGSSDAEGVVSGADTASDDTASDDTASDDTASELSADGIALATAMTEFTIADGNPFPRDEVQCANEAIVSSIGLDELNGYGLTVDSPDEDQIPEEYETQAAITESVLGCVDVAGTMRSLAPPDCDLPVTDEEMELALEYDFLGAFPEYDNPAAAAASDAMNAAVAACG